MIYIYGRLLSWFGGNRALAMTSLLSAVVMTGCYALIVRGYHIASAIIYVFREAYIVLIIEQYWSFVNSTLNPKQASLINGPFCAIGSLGSITGGFLVSRLAKPLGTEVLLLMAAASLLPATACSAMAYKLGGEPQPSEVEKGGKRGHTGVRVLLQSRYLIFLFCLIVTTQVVSTVLDLRFNGLVEESIPDKDARTAFYGKFYGPWLGTSAAVLQFLGAPLLLRFLPLTLIHLGIPIIHFIACGLLTIAPSLRTGAMAFLLFKAFDYSIFRAGKEIFYIPLSFDARYRAKQLIDSFGYRSAKSGTGLIIALFGLAKTIPGVAFSIIAMVMAVIWSGIVSNLTKQYQKIS
jgi:AAA family ATP:ADP antiporter